MDMAVQPLPTLVDANWQVIDDLRAEQAKLVRAIAARDAFLAIAAHELRNPMTPILGRVTLLRRSVERGSLSADAIVADLDRIEKLVLTFIKRATTLLDLSTSDLSRAPISVQLVDISRLVSGLVDSYRPVVEHAGVALELFGCNDVPVFARSDPFSLEQVLENLLSNAMKYGAGSPITITVAAAEGLTHIVVRDRGPGIPHEHQVRIFERYERVVSSGINITGYGVGLWIVKTLCEAMGGSVDVSSQPGDGAAFRVTLPLDRAEQSA